MSYIIKAVIFDLDGTLLNTAQGIENSVAYVLRHLGLPPLPPDQLASFIGPPIYESLQKHYDLQGEKLLYATELFRSVYKDRFLFEAYPYEGIVLLLRALRDCNIKLAVATNKRIDYTLKLLGHFKLTPLFDTIQGSDFENTKQKADIIGCALRELSFPPSQVVMVGDTISDMNGAACNNIPFIAVRYGFGFHDENADSAVCAVDSVESLFSAIVPMHAN